MVFKSILGFIFILLLIISVITVIGLLIVMIITHHELKKQKYFRDLAYMNSPRKTKIKKK